MSLDAKHLDTIMTALVERRNRLVQLDHTDTVHAPSRPTLRQRINEVNAAIRALQRPGA